MRACARNFASRQEAQLAAGWSTRSCSLALLFALRVLSRLIHDPSIISLRSHRTKLILYRPRVFWSGLVWSIAALTAKAPPLSQSSTSLLALCCAVLHDWSHLIRRGMSCNAVPLQVAG